MPFPTGWARKCALTINSAQIVGSGTHNNFPVLLTQANLPSGMLDKDGAAPARMGGGDIRFTSDAAGTTKLPCHVVEFITANNPANARATIYVALNLPTGSSTTIYVWYRTATEIDQPKYNANPDADGFQGSDYVWANYDIVLPLGGFGGLRNLKQANAAKNLGRFGATVTARYHLVAERATGNKYISFPSLVKAGERLYCTAREATTHVVSLTGVVGVRYSDDMGRTWAEDAGLGVSDGAYDLREPRLLFQSDGTLWLFYTKTNAADTSRIVAYRKASAPYTAWGAESVLTSQTKANNGAKPAELSSGRIVVPCYEIDGSGNTAPFIRWTDDSGANWTTDYLTADGTAPGSFDTYNETSIAEDPTTPGNLVAIMRRNGFQNLYRQTSTDAGQTWSAAASVSALAIDAGSLPDMPELLYAKDGDLLCAYAKDRNAPEFRVVRSTDHGATWSAQYAFLWGNEFSLTPRPGGFTGSGGYCSLVEISKGLFAVVYYFDNNATQKSNLWCGHVSKVEDGELNYWTDTTLAAPAQVGDGAELYDTDYLIGSGSLSYWNNVHNGGAFTISGWAKFNQTADEAHCFVGSTVGSSDRGFFFAYDNRAAAGNLDALRLYKADGAGGAIQNQSTAITGDTSPHRFGVFCSAGGVPTFIKDTTTYAGASAITGTAGDAELNMRIGGASVSPNLPESDLATFRLDGWMGMWTFSASNLGADYEKTRYNTEKTPATFVAAGSPVEATAPDLTGSITVGDLTSTSYTLTCPAATDDTAVDGYQYRLNGGSWVTIAGGARTVSVTGRTPSSTDAVEMRAFDAAMNFSAALSTSVTLSGGTVTAAVAATGTVTYTGTAAVVATIVSGSDVTAAVAATGSIIYTGTAAVVASLVTVEVAPDPVGLRFEDWLHRVLPYVPGCPPQTALLHLLDAAKTFCRRTLAWNYQHTPIATVALQANYSLSLAAGTKLVKVLGCEIAGGATYSVQNGALGRKFVREAAGRNVCVLSSPSTITLYPVPPVSGQSLIVDVALMPDTDVAVWPDELAEHMEYIAAGAIGTLCAMPKVAWRDIDTAADQRDHFERRIHAVYHTTVRTLVRPEAARQSVYF